MQVLVKGNLKVFFLCVFRIVSSFVVCEMVLVCVIGFSIRDSLTFIRMESDKLSVAPLVKIALELIVGNLGRFLLFGISWCHRRIGRCLNEHNLVDH